MTSTQTARRPQAHLEMLEKSHLHETFFSLKNAGQQRPASVATEFMESDWDDDEILSDVDDGESSPRVSLNSSSQPSFTTLSSYEEVHTPRLSRNRTAFPFDADLKPVDGPRGPHLFRSSLSSAHSVEYQNALSLSPITPRVSGPPETEFQLPIALDLSSPPLKRRSGPFRFTDEELDTTDLSAWTPEKVAQWMLNAGIELQAAERFVENDINGAIMITLKFEDLKELGISSFGVRTTIWEQIHIMRNIRPSSPAPSTDIEEEPDREVRRERRRQDQETKPERKASRRRPRPSHEDIISPLESVSIVGIEQMIPKPHHCSKGENCPKYRRFQRMVEAFKKDHPFVNTDEGVIMIAGDPGNPMTAEALRPADDVFRPVSDAIPSVVASSDVMGPGGQPIFQYLQEATLRNVQSRDPQDNVRQFLDFQQTVGSCEVPPTPPFEIYPQQQAHEGLRTLPKLSIPSQSHRSPPRLGSARPPSVVRVDGVESSPDMTPTGPYRFGTPFSDMDVPVTAVPLGPVARDASQSVPPDMNYRHVQNPPPRAMNMSRASARRPSFPVMPSVDENLVTPIQTRPSPGALARVAQTGQRPMQPPPRVQYPWGSSATVEKAIAPIPRAAAPGQIASSAASAANRLSPLGGQPKDPSGVAFQGPMRKRKTKMLRHEWNEHYFTLKGTRLNMHKDAAAVSRTLEYIDIDDYAIACSSLASGKLNAAFKAMSIRRGADKKDAADVAAFSFELVPQDGKGGVRLRKRESSVPASARPSAGEGVNGTGRSHHFAVKSRDERIDWMRELMLAKALKQKVAEGFEVSVNGNMI